MNGAPRLIITREASRTREWADRLRAWDFSVVEMPLLRFVPIEPDPELRTRSFDWILFTSPQGVRAFIEADLNPRGSRLGTLGQGTARAIKDAGLCDNLGIGARDGRELANAFVALAPGGATVLLPGPRKRGPEVEQILAEAGYQVTMAPLYDTLPLDPAELPEEPFRSGDLVFFCSPSTVRAFCEKWDARPDCITIGETTAAMTRELGFPTRVADTPDLEAMLQAAGLDVPQPPTSMESPS